MELHLSKAVLNHGATSWQSHEHLIIIISNTVLLMLSIFLKFAINNPRFIIKAMRPVEIYTGYTGFCSKIKRFTIKHEQPGLICNVSNTELNRTWRARGLDTQLKTGYIENGSIFFMTTLIYNGWCLLIAMRYTQNNKYETCH